MAERKGGAVYQIPQQTELEKPVEVFEEAKLDESYKRGATLRSLGKGVCVSSAKYDGELFHFGTHSGEIRSLDMSKVKIDAGQPKEVQTVRLAADGKVSASCFDVSKGAFFVGDYTGGVSIFDRVSGNCKAYASEHTQRVAAIEAKGGKLFHTGYDGYLLVKDIEKDRVVHSWISTVSPLSSMIVRGENSVVVGSWDGSVSRIDLRAKSCEQSLCGRSPVRDIAMSDDGNILAAAHGIGGLRSWDFRIDGGQRPLVEAYGKGKGHSEVVNRVIINKNRLFSSSDDKTVKMFSLDQGKCLETLTGHGSGVMDVAMVNDLLVSVEVGMLRKYSLPLIENAQAYYAELEQRKAEAKQQTAEDPAVPKSGKGGKKKKGKKGKKKKKKK